ncbi:hypothetical protein [Dyella koreensis]|uniref:Uncharacterized protein n=1 Tax=Dyella koreensis TaxID=311235 RepID=A0ABW8K7Q8_9GAMM
MPKILNRVGGIHGGMKMKTQEHKPVTIRLSAESGAGEAKNLYAYVADKRGKVIESVPFKGLEAQLRSTRGELEGQAKLYIAQGVPSQAASKLNERTLLKAGAYQVVQNFSGHVIDVLRVPAAVLQPWIWNNCLITGHLSKDFLIDGQSVNQPVCNARVHICEVETEFVFPHIPIYYRPIPDWVISEISERFASLSQLNVAPPPIPDPIGPISQTLISTGPRPAPAASLKMKAAALPEIPAHVLRSLTSGSAETVRQAIYANHALLYPYFCLWPIYWPWLYTCDEETVVYSDCNGHFEMWENTFSEDGPLNIYVWVEVNINGQWVTVYRPSLPCHTWWNYTCGTDINIKVTDPRVMPCDCGINAHGELAWFRSIGESATALHIEQSDANAVSVQGGVSLFNVGCTDIIDAKRISPFGGTLNFKLLFGDGLPTAGVTHYRWTRTRIKDANLNDIFGASPQVINGQVAKTYFVITQSGGQFHFETHAITLGAEGSGQDIGYRIPQWDIYNEPLVPSTDKALTIQWTSPDFWSASIDSHALDDGLYRFDLELGTMSAGAFQVVAVPKAVFQVSDYSNSGNSVNAPDYDLHIDSGNTAHALALSFKVRIDNAPCSAVIQNAELTDGAGHLVYVNGVPVVSGKCGFIHYTSLAQGVRISFNASHPRNFATFSFGVIKGNNTDPTGVSASGYVLSGVDGFALSGGLFTQDVSVPQLLGTCPQAAFSENLNVYALATDGTYRLQSGYDASDVKAFALSNT